VVRRLRKVAGTTYAAEAGIRINDKPMPLFQLLVLCMPASKPIDATTAIRAARYDESSATRLVEMAERIAVAEKLKPFKGIGDIGADIFLREVQEVWTWVRSHFDYRATAAAKRLGLPAQPAKLGDPAARFNARLAG